MGSITVVGTKLGNTNKAEEYDYQTYTNDQAFSFVRNASYADSSTTTTTLQCKASCDKHDSNPYPYNWDWYPWIERCYFYFDLSGIEDYWRITAAELKINISSADSDTDLELVESSAGTSLSSGDYDAVGDTSFASFGNVSGGVETANLNSSGIAYLNANKGSTVVGFAFREDHDLNNSAPHEDDPRLAWFDSGSGYYPELTITYEEVTQTCTETITIIDLFPLANSKVLTETITLADTVIKDIEAVRTETVNMLSNLVQAFNSTDFYIYLAETVSVTDSILKAITKTLTETITLADNFSTKDVLNQILTDTVSLTVSVKAIMDGITVGVWRRISKYIDHIYYGDY